MKTLTLLMFLSLNVLSQTRESAYYSDYGTSIVGNKVTHEYKENFVVKVDYHTRVITLSYDDQKQAVLFTSSAVNDEKTTITYFLEKNQAYYRVSIHRSETESFIMFLQESKTEPALILHGVKILYTK